MVKNMCLLLYNWQTLRLRMDPVIPGTHEGIVDLKAILSVVIIF